MNEGQIAWTDKLNKHISSWKDMKIIFLLSFQVIMSPSSTSSSTDSEVEVPRRQILEDKETGSSKHSTDGDSVFGTANVTLETPEDEEPIKYFVFCVFQSFHSFLIYLFILYLNQSKKKNLRSQATDDYWDPGQWKPVVTLHSKEKEQKEEFRVQNLQKDIWPRVQAQLSYAFAHGRKAVCLWHMSEAVRQDVRPQDPPADAHQRAALQVRWLPEKVRQRQQFAQTLEDEQLRATQHRGAVI